MGRAALLTLTVLWLTGCGPSEAVRELGHRGLACTACHQGPSADREMASVPPRTCTGSGCHQDEVPGSMDLRTVRFEHRGHGSTDEVALGCVGCHTHEAGGDPIEGSTGTCGLCHQEELEGPGGAGCRVCHAELSHEGRTPQGLVIPHQAFPQFAKGCSRCHYEVTEPVQEIDVERCASCHVDMGEVRRAGIGADLHPSHVSVPCESCHETDTHRIESMSSAVSIVCTDCHDVEHYVDLEDAEAWSPTCLGCHRESHVDEQALLLGIEPERPGPSPDRHFSDGLTCASCHTEGSGSRPVRAGEAGEGCVACHEDGYRIVALWWAAGVRDRLATVDEYLASAEGAALRLPADDPDRIRLTSARDRLDLVRRGGGVHNIRLTHQLFEDVVETSRAALQSTGLDPDPVPALGRLPRAGFCSYCHYHVDQAQETWDTPVQFHLP